MAPRDDRNDDRSRPGGEPHRRAPADLGRPDQPVLPDISTDETADGWSEPAEDDDERFLGEVPPHHRG